MGPAPHWSHAFTALLATELRRCGGLVTWFAGMTKENAEANKDVEEPRVFLQEAAAFDDVARNHQDTALEIAVSNHLRVHVAAVVVHVGLGARGTPNVLWLADRLGSRAIACVRGAEVVCARGNLRDRDGKACTNYEDAERCGWCCKAGRGSRPHLVDVQNRTDLLAAGLLVAETVFVASDADLPMTRSLGLAAARVKVGHDVKTIATSVLRGTS